MKKTIALTLLLMLSLGSSLALAKKKVQGPQFQFSCMNYWNQEKLVIIDAPSEDAARLKLRNDPELYEEYRNECSSRGMVTPKNTTAKKTVKADEPVKASE